MRMTDGKRSEVLAKLEALCIPNDGVISKTATEQRKTEEMCYLFLHSKRTAETRAEGKLRRSETATFSSTPLKGLLPSGYQALDASRPWLVYWVMNTLQMLNSPPNDDILTSIISFLNACQDPEGGFGGGPGQLPHTATSYAAVNALVATGRKEALDVINRESLYKWFMSIKAPDGGFRMHKDGETDIRGTYCVMSMATICNLMTPELTEGVSEYITACQTYEGGLGGYPGNEAHGGYTFCGLAAAMLIGAPDAVDLQALLTWAVGRQMSLEGGFQGRTNKLVDGCYSFWVGALFPLLRELESFGHLSPSRAVVLTPTTPSGGWVNLLLSRGLKEVDVVNALLKGEGIEEGAAGVLSDEDGELLVNQPALQSYLLFASMDQHGGGFKDKPGKRVDFYHTAYGLAGLSIAQDGGRAVMGDLAQNAVMPIHPLFNIPIVQVAQALEHFSAMPKVR